MCSTELESSIFLSIYFIDKNIHYKVVICQDRKMILGQIDKLGYFLQISRIKREVSKTPALNLARLSRLNIKICLNR